MKQIVLLLFVIFFAGSFFAQSNDCLTAVTLTSSADCTSPISGSTAGFTQSASIPVCIGTPDDDGWYKFVANATSHFITVNGSSSYDAVIQAFSGTCATLTSLGCVDNSLVSGSEALNLTGLTIGNTYYIRVYDYYAGSGSGTFSICLTGPATAPVNDYCANAVTLSVNSGCINTAGTSLAATQSMAGCSGDANDDVWYKFVANNYTQDITLTCSSNFDGVIQLVQGTCTPFSFTSLYCQDDLSFGGTETINATNLTIGTIYFIRVYEYGSGAGGTFSICVSGNATTPAQPNDEPCNAIQLQEITSACNYVTFSNVGATSTSTTTAPLPFSCTGGSSGAGGFVSGTSKDVWFKITVPASGIISITPKPNQISPNWITDASMALYKGSCGSLTQIACSRDYTLYPGSGDDLLPFYVTNTATPLSANTTVYLRVWPDNSTATGNFAFCIQSPTNDNCANALYVCNLNGFSGSTSEAYHADRPGTGSGQMYGNNELPSGKDTTNGVNTGGPFGFYPSTATSSTTAGPYSSPNIDVNIENNSWIKFTASAATANLKVVVGDCFVGGYPTGGLQMQIFSATGCDNFFPVSNFEENSTGFTVTGFGLTIGNVYYLMVDGFKNDICNYTIQALDGVAFPSIVASPTAVCAGSSSTLTAPSATSYSWMPGGATTQSIVVTPDKSISTYTCIVEGVCGQKQTLVKSVIVKPLPTIAINSGTAITTCGTQTITLTGSGANTYTWNTGSTSPSFTRAPTTTTTYSVKGTALNGCTNTAVSIVTVNPLPSFTLTSSLTNTICFGKSTVLTASGTAIGYTWSPGNIAATSITVSPTSNQVYQVTGINAEGCSKIVTTTITVNPLPSVTANSVTICNGKTGVIIASGAVSYIWNTGPTTASISINPTITTTYSVVGTSSLNCTNSAVGQVSVTPIPTVTINSGNPITVCNTKSVTLTGDGAATYTWNTGSTTASISVAPGSNTTYTLTGAASVTGCTNIAIATVSVNSLPNILTSGTSTICNGKSTVLTATNGVTYTWTPGGSVAPSITVSPTSNTPYTVTGTGSNGCINTSITTVTVNSLPSLSINSTTICNGNVATLTSTGSAISYTWNTGSNSTSITPSPTTTTNYSITGTSANSCTNSAVGQVSVIALPNITVGSGTICQNKSYTLTANSASSYTWSTGQNGPSISVTPTTTTVYTVTGTAATTCSNSATATITVNELPQLVSTPSISPSNCSASTGSITNISVTGSPVLSYTWTNSSAVNVGNSPNLNNQTAGTYYLNVSDGNSCTSNFGPYIITNPGAQPSPTIDVVASPVCEGGNIDLVSTSASSYTWTGPGGYTSNAQSPSILNVNTTATGLYVLSVTYTNGCQASASVSVTVNANPLVNASASSSSVCVGNTINLFGSSASTYTWSGPGSYSSNIQNPTITTINITGSGVYTLSLTDANNCQNSATVNVTVNLNPVITVTANPGIVCVGQTISLTATGGDGYNWIGPDGFTDTNQSPNILNSVTANAGDYTVTVTASNSCTTSAVTTVSVNSLPTFTSGVNSADICYGSTIQFNAGSGVNVYSWDGPNSFSVTNNASPSIANATPFNSGTYTVTAGGGSCSASQTIAVNVYPQIILSASATSTAICEGTDLQLLGSSASSYTWSGPGSYTSNNQNPQIINAPITTSGTYSYALTDANNCINSATLAIIVNANPTATASANPSSICDGETINLNAGGGTSYSWSGPNGYSSGFQNPNILNAGSVYSGDYTVTVTDANSCSSLTVTSVTVNALPSYTWSANASNVCYGGVIQLDASSNAFTYLWSGPNSFTYSGSSTTINNATILNSGIYTVTATDLNCSQSQTVSVNVYSQIVMNASANGNIVCTGNTINLIGTGGGGYSWSGPNNFSSTSQNPQIVNADAITIGIYTLTVTDATTSCTEADTVLISITPTPTLVGTTNGSTCFGGTLNLSADFGTGVNVNWYTDAALTNTVQINSTTYQPTFSVDGTYIYYVQGTVDGCLSSVATVTAQYNNINAVAIADVYTGNVPLSVNFTNNSTGVTSTDNFSWIFGDNTGSAVLNPNHIFENEGNYNVLLIIKDVESGCIDTATVVINVEDGFTIEVPNVFTPNEDGANDAFHIKITGVKSAEGYIYNRWGQLLYSWDVLNVSWDGKASNGEDCPDATYYYLIKLIDKKGKEHIAPGYVLIIR